MPKSMQISPESTTPYLFLFLLGLLYFPPKQMSSHWFRWCDCLIDNDKLFLQASCFKVGKRRNKGALTGDVSSLQSSTPCLQTVYSFIHLLKGLVQALMCYSSCRPRGAGLLALNMVVAAAGQGREMTGWGHVTAQ